MVVGYNEATNEVGVSDSWGPRYELRWVHVDIARAVTSSGGFVIDFQRLEPQVLETRPRGSTSSISPASIITDCGAVQRGGRNDYGYGLLRQEYESLISVSEKEGKVFGCSTGVFK